MTFEQLKKKANHLPSAPGVYIMRDSSNKVIYVGKAKKLCNRVSQYFQDSANHSPKTRLMVSNISDFDVIVASSEFEALVLECAQIKRYLPKYNILLKDDKGYPYLRLNMKEKYPRLTMVSKPANDGAVYYGPFGSRGVTQNLLDTIVTTLQLPSCSRKFPQEIGKGRPCLHYHMNQCFGWCTGKRTQQEYLSTIEQARQLLIGNYKQVTDSLRQQMQEASECLNFELAASLRDRIQAIQALDQKQWVTAGNASETDAIGYGQTETKACLTVLHFSNGELVDKEYEIIPADDSRQIVSSLVKQYYLSRGLAPKTVLLPFEMEDASLFEILLQERFGRKTKIYVPQRGEHFRRMELACKNAQEEAERVTNLEERRSGKLDSLQKMLCVSSVRWIEAYDISNIMGTDNVASMVVFEDGKPRKSAYKHFKVDMNGVQNDYGSMRQVLERRLTNLLEGQKGFDRKPDILLIDGGINHAKVAFEVLSFLNLEIPVFGMVKDDRHRTRALVTAEGKEIRIDNNQAIFSLIGLIQEEAHRFAISYHKNLRSKRLRYSQLDQIPGIGPKRKQDLLRHFSSIAAIKQASLEELKRYLPQNTAFAVYQHFHTEEE